MDIEANWTLPLSENESVAVCLCESAISITFRGLNDADDSTQTVLHLDPAAVGQIIALLTIAADGWVKAARSSLEEEEQQNCEMP